MNQAGWLARVLLVRLRFPLLLLLAVLIVARWESIATLADRAIDRALGRSTPGTAVSSDTEYFCPMDPGVLSDWPSKCPICNMALVRRKRGDATPLPEGVVARMQLSPYRIQLAGLATTTLAYQPLFYVVEGTARVEPGPVETTSGLRLAFVADPIGTESLAPGLSAVIDDGRGGTWQGRVQAVDLPDDATLTIDDVPDLVRPTGPLLARILIPASDLPALSEVPRDPPPAPSGPAPTLFHCPDHPDVVRESAGACPIDEAPLAPLTLAANQRLGYWCPMHPRITAEAAGASCEACGGMVLVPRIVSYAPPGEVLAVPTSAVIDTGTRRVVYVERMPGLFDGVEVRLGPRCGESFPVIAGLESGQKVVTSGAFLLDAETRLNPGLAAAYFGASRPASVATPLASGSDQAADDPTDLVAIVRQQTCPVTGATLGSMGPPPKVTVDGQAVYLCCAGCRGAIEREPAKYLAKLTWADAKVDRP